MAENPKVGDWCDIVDIYGNHIFTDILVSELKDKYVFGSPFGLVEFPKKQVSHVSKKEVFKRKLEGNL